MTARRRLQVVALIGGMSPGVFSQALGHLLYATPEGRAISLEIRKGSGDTVVLKPEVGEAERFRRFVQAHAGVELKVARSGNPLPEPAPSGWRVSGRRTDQLVKTPVAVFWRYLPGRVIPVRFTFEGKSWELRSAQIPEKEWEKRLP